MPLREYSSTNDGNEFMGASCRRHVVRTDGGPRQRLDRRMDLDAKSFSCARAYGMGRGRLESRPYKDSGNDRKRLQNDLGETTESVAEHAGLTVWQRNYYEHIVRTEGELERIRDYIRENPAKWDEDSENPQANAPVSRGDKPER
jgi:REP element-mobilizing transposase RayT